MVGFSWITSPAATELEMIVLDWLASLLKLPDDFLSTGKKLDIFFHYSVTEHVKACMKNQHVLIPFAFDTFVFFCTLELLNRVQWVMHSNVVTPTSIDAVFKRISFAIQKGLAAQLVACLPSTSM